jgi:hypothetical protein
MHFSLTPWTACAVATLLLAGAARADLADPGGLGGIGDPPHSQATFDGELVDGTLAAYLAQDVLLDWWDCHDHVDHTISWNPVDDCVMLLESAMDGFHLIRLSAEECPADADPDLCHGAYRKDFWFDLAADVDATADALTWSGWVEAWGAGGRAECELASDPSAPLPTFFPHWVVDEQPYEAGGLWFSTEPVDSGPMVAMTPGVLTGDYEWWLWQDDDFQSEWDSEGQVTGSHATDGDAGAVTIRVASCDANAARLVDAVGEALDRWYDGLHDGSLDAAWETYTTSLGTPCDWLPYVPDGYDVESRDLTEEMAYALHNAVADVLAEDLAAEYAAWAGGCS